MEPIDEVKLLFESLFLDRPIWLTLLLLGGVSWVGYTIVKALRQRDWWELVTTFGALFTWWSIFEWWDGNWPIGIPILSGVATLIWALGKGDGKAKGRDE